MNLPGPAGVRHRPIKNGQKTFKFPLPTCPTLPARTGICEECLRPTTYHRIHDAPPVISVRETNTFRRSIQRAFRVTGNYAKGPLRNMIVWTFEHSVPFSLFRPLHSSTYIRKPAFEVEGGSTPPPPRIPSRRFSCRPARDRHKTWPYFAHFSKIGIFSIFLSLFLLDFLSCSLLDLVLLFVHIFRCIALLWSVLFHWE